MMLYQMSQELVMDTVGIASPYVSLSVNPKRTRKPWRVQVLLSIVFPTAEAPASWQFQLPMWILLLGWVGAVNELEV